MNRSFVLALPVFPGRRQPSIVGGDELNYRVRNGNGWTLILVNTNYLLSGLPENILIVPLALSPVKRFFLAPLVTRTGFEPMLTA